MITLEELQSKGGEAYSASGKRNPIRKDTNQILTGLVLARSPQTILEVGTAYGVSAMCMGIGMPAGSRLITYEFDAGVAKEAQETLREAGVNALVVAGPFPQSFDPSILGKHLIDMVFLDGEKGGYFRDFMALRSYLSPTAMILADNVIDRESECRLFLDYMEENYRVVTIHTECGLLVATK